MIWSIPALQNATIYESDQYRNTGLDSILELKKETLSSGIHESRILIKFDLTSLSASLSENNVSINNVTSSLRLYNVQSFELPKSYTVEAKIVSEDWSNGSGYFNFPTTDITYSSITDGVTWKTTSGSGSLYWTSSLNAGTTSSFISKSGGGRWYTSSIASQSFNFKSNDSLDIDVSNIVKAWYTGSYNNYGFLVTLKNSEITSVNYPDTNIQFYSSFTTTVFEPQLYIQWADVQTYATGSLSVITKEDDPIIYLRSFEGVYQKDTKVRILLGSRKKFPRPTFSQNSSFSTMYALPVNTYYQIKDAHNDQIVVPYSNYTKINTNSSGSYFDFYTTMLYPERYYKFEFKVNYSESIEYFNSNDFLFKIIK
jgi:hypothetical protein